MFLSKTALTIPVWLKSCQAIKKGLWRPWVQTLKIKTQEKLFFPFGKTLQN